MSTPNTPAPVQPATTKVLDDLLAQLSLDFDLDNPLSQSQSQSQAQAQSPPPLLPTSASHVTFSEFDWADLNAMADHIDELLDDSTPLGHSHSQPTPTPVSTRKRSAASKRLSRVILSSSSSFSQLASTTATTMAKVDEVMDDDEDDQAPIATTLSRSASRSHRHSHSHSHFHPHAQQLALAPAAETATAATAASTTTQKRRRSRSKSKTRQRALSPASPPPPPPTTTTTTATLAQKLAKAKIQKLHTKVQIGSNPPTRITQPISVASITPAQDIVEYLSDTLDITSIDSVDATSSTVVVEPLLATINDNQDNQDNNDEPPPEYTLFEYFSDLSLVRPIRPWEPLGDVLRSWEPAGSSNVLAMQRDTYARLPEYALLGPPARFSGVLHWESRLGHFKKRHVELRLGAESRRHATSDFAAPGTLTGAIDVAQPTDVASVWMGRPKSSAPVDTLVCSLAHFDVYTMEAGAPARKRAPTKFGFALKNAAARMAQFEEKSEYVHWFYAETQKEVRAWVLALRACKAHVDRYMHGEWFDDDDEDQVAGEEKPVDDHDVERKSVSHQSEKSTTGHQQPMFHTLLNLDAETKPIARHPVDDGGPLLRDISAPTSSIHHGTTIAPLGANGKPLLDFSENLAGFTLERPTLLASTLARSKTMSGTSPSHGPRQIPGTMGGATLHRSASESHHSTTSPGGSRSHSRARASPGGSPTMAPRGHAHAGRALSPSAHRYHCGGASDSASTGHRDGNQDDSDDDDDELPLGTLSRRPTMQSGASGTSNSNSPYLMPLQLPVGGGAAAASVPATSTTTLARNRSMSRTRPAAATATATGAGRPAAGAHLGGSLDESNVGGKGTLLDQIGRRRNESTGASGAAASGQRRGLIDQIPSGRSGGATGGGRW